MSDEDLELVSLFEGLDTPTLSDGLDRLGIAGQCLGIAPLTSSTKMIIGPAFTVRIVPVSTPPSGTLGDYLDEVGAGDIVVLDNNGRIDCSVWGDIITRYAIARKFGGTIIDGVCRDVGKTAGGGYPLYTRGQFMRSGKGRLQVEASNVPVSIGGARVSPRDIVIADVNGVVVVPRGHARNVADVAWEIARAESQMHDQIDQGKTMKEAWAHFASRAI
jgi:regulator of RNase E activity RraA